MSGRSRRLKVATTDIIKTATSTASEGKRRMVRMVAVVENAHNVSAEFDAGGLVDLDDTDDADDLDLSSSVAAGTMKKKRKSGKRTPLSSIFDPIDNNVPAEEKEDSVVQLYDDTPLDLSNLDSSPRKRRSKQHHKSKHNHSGDSTTESFADRQQQQQIEHDSTDTEEVKDEEEHEDYGEDDKYASRESNADYWDRNCRYGGFKDCICRALCCKTTVTDDLEEDITTITTVKKVRPSTARRGPTTTTARWGLFWWWVVKIMFYLAFGVFGAFIQRLIIFFTTGSTAYEIGKMEVIDIPSWGDVLMGFCFSAAGMLVDIILSRMFKDWIRGWTGTWADAAAATTSPSPLTFDVGNNNDTGDNINNIRAINGLQ